MKTHFLLLILFLSFISCKKEAENSYQIPKIKKNSIEDLNADSKVDVAIITDSVVVRQEYYLLDFEKFRTEPYIFTQKAPLDFSSNEGAKYFKTRVIDAYKSNQTDFASYYIGVIFGCGASCIAGFIVDVRDGKIYDLPLGEEHSCLFAEDRAICEQNSRLFISGVCKENPEDETLFYDAHVWNETLKTFEKIEEQEILKKSIKQ